MSSSNQLHQLLAASRTSPEVADRLLTVYRPALRMLAEQMVGPGLRRREDASDIVQRTMLEAYEAIDSFQGRTEPEFSAWLRRILSRNVSNLVRDNRAAKRDVRREKFFDDGNESLSVTWLQPAGRGSTPSMHLIKAEAVLKLAHALDSLPEAQKRAVRMRHLQGLSINEIAAAMEKSPAAVAGLIRRGLESLRQQCKESAAWLR